MHTILFTSVFSGASVSKISNFGFLAIFEPLRRRVAIFRIVKSSFTVNYMLQALLSSGHPFFYDKWFRSYKGFKILGNMMTSSSKRVMTSSKNAYFAKNWYIRHVLYMYTISCLKL